MIFEVWRPGECDIRHSAGQIFQAKFSCFVQLIALK